MRNIRTLQFLVYVAFGLLIVHNVLPAATRGFKEGWKDGSNEMNGIETSSQTVPAMLSNSTLASPALNNLKIGNTYILRNMSINADIAVTGSSNINTWLTVAGIILVLGTTVVLVMIAYNINMVIVNVAQGNGFEQACIRHIRRTGSLLLTYCIADVLYQRVCFAQLTQVIQAPLKVINTTSFNFEVLICGILTFIIAEAFKQGNELKQEQDLTI